MTAHDQPVRRRARFLQLLAVAAFLLGLCSTSGCEDKSTPPVSGSALSNPAKPEGPGATKLKRVPRTPK